jgi:phosphonopyruvate decarboxylase
MSIEASEFIDVLRDLGVQFFAGVPDSLLKELCISIDRTVSPEHHLIACNEGAAVGAAIGYHLATGTAPVVYMQNSGLGNAINPITSLAAPDIFSIPMLLLIGWRGEIEDDGHQIHDEPQHIKQGAITLDQLDVVGIRHEVLGENTSDYRRVVKRLLDHAVIAQEPVALVCRKNTFQPYPIGQRSVDLSLMTREYAIRQCLDCIPPHAAIVTTTGMTSREVFELRENAHETHHQDFLTIGGMGHASSIALGVSIAMKEQLVVCIDGDGALLMHMGALTQSSQRRNFLHIVLNNGVHDSVGGQSTAAARLKLSNVAAAAGYGRVSTVESSEALQTTLSEFADGECSSFIEIVCRPGYRSNLGRPTISPKSNKQNFMKYLSDHVIRRFKRQMSMHKDNLYNL